jgi:copper homeostasis protein
MGRLEVACFNATSALRAAAAGVDRIELCSDRASGGITPPLALLKELRSQIPSKIPINVMIRPRGRDFVYTETELGEMVSSMHAMKPYCNGFVFGILKADSTVDVKACKDLVKLADPLPCTFHRAFDEASAVSKPLKALDEVSACGFKTILTSGGPGNAVDNLDALRDLSLATCRIPSLVNSVAVSKRSLGQSAAGDVITMAGGGLRKESIATLQRSGIRLEWYHTSAIVDDGETADEHELIACKIQAGKGP